MPVIFESCYFKNSFLVIMAQNPNFDPNGLDIATNQTRDHPFKTSANYSQFLPPASPTVGSFLLLSVGKFGKFLTPSPLKNADVLNELPPST